MEILRGCINQLYGCLAPYDHWVATGLALAYLAIFAALKR